MKDVIFIIGLVSALGANASFVGGKDSSAIFGAGVIKFGVGSPPNDTCDHFGRNFKFDATTAEGKNILTILLASNMSNTKIDIWYSPSPAAGTNQENGCTIDSLAIVHEIGVSG